MVSMVTDLKLKNAISQLLIKLEICGFQYLHLHFQLFMVQLDEDLSEKLAKYLTHPLCKYPYCANCTSTMTSSVFIGLSPCKPTRDNTKVCQITQLSTDSQVLV